MVSIVSEPSIQEIRTGRPHRCRSCFDGSECVRASASCGEHASSVIVPCGSDQYRTPTWRKQICTNMWKRFPTPASLRNQLRARIWLIPCCCICTYFSFAAGYRSSRKAATPVTERAGDEQNPRPVPSLPNKASAPQEATAVGDRLLYEVARQTRSLSFVLGGGSA